MTLDEDNVRRALKRSLDSFSAPDEMPASTRRRAHQKRVVYYATTVAAILLVLTTATWAAVEWERSPGPVAPVENNGLIRLVTQPRGLIELEPGRGQACYRFEMRGVTSAHVHREGSSEVFLDLPNNEAGLYAVLGCATNLDPQHLGQIADNPDEFTIEFHNSSSGGTETAILQLDHGETDCPPVRVGSKAEYGLHFSATSGQPGDQIHVWGTTLRTEGGAYAPSDRLELWWNAEAPDEDRPQRSGPVVKLAGIDTSDRCYLQTSFELPDVPEGTYDITGFIWKDPPEDGYGVFSAEVFQVSSDEDSAEQYPLLVEDGWMRVYGPDENHRLGRCPGGAQALSTRDLHSAERAVLLAASEISGGLDTGEATVDAVFPTERSGPPDFERMIEKGCGNDFAERTILVVLHLPRVQSASMGTTTYFVSREPRGWVIWNAW